MRLLKKYRKLGFLCLSREGGNLDSLGPRMREEDGAVCELEGLSVTSFSQDKQALNLFVTIFSVSYFQNNNVIFFNIKQDTVIAYSKTPVAKLMVGKSFCEIQWIILR